MRLIDRLDALPPRAAFKVALASIAVSTLMVFAALWKAGLWLWGLGS